MAWAKESFKWFSTGALMFFQRFTLYMQVPYTVLESKLRTYSSQSKEATCIFQDSRANSYPLFSQKGHGYLRYHEHIRIMYKKVGMQMRAKIESTMYASICHI